MEEVGVIVGNVVVVDLEYVGKFIIVIVEVYVECINIVVMVVFKKVFFGFEVQQCYYVMGEVDFVFIFNVVMMMEYEVFVCCLFDDNDNIKWYCMVVVFNCVKVGLEVLLGQ